MPQEVSDCMIETFSLGQPPDACLVDIFLGKRGRDMKREDYFAYEPVDDNGYRGGLRETMYTDACEVFTGPAAYLPENNTFEHCVDNDMVTQCNIPSFIWSGRSTGRTPVANYHSWRDSPTTANSANAREERALERFRQIGTEMAELIRAVNDSFVSDPLQIELFSAEGALCLPTPVFFTHTWAPVHT